jgi:hypothetical protein
MKIRKWKLLFSKTFSIKEIYASATTRGLITEQGSTITAVQVLFYTDT